MKKFIIIIITLIVMSLNLNAVTIKPWIAETTINMDDLHSYEEMENVTAVDVNNIGYILGCDIGILRIEYLKAFSTSIIPWSITPGINYIDQIDSELYIVSVGSIIKKLKKPKLIISAYVGYGYALVNEVVKRLETTPTFETISTNLPCMGSSPVVEIIITSKLWKTLEFGLGYRYAIVEEVTLTKDVDIEDFISSKGQSPFPDNIDFDYSGLSLSLSLRFGPTLKNN